MTLPRGLSIHVGSVAARAAVGLTATQVALCARARRLEPRSSAFVDARGRSVGLCTAGGLEPSLVGYDRLAALAAAALDDLARARWASSVPLLLAVPEPGRPDDDPRLDGAILAELAARVPAPIDLAASRVVRAGHAGGAVAVELAVGLLAAGAPGVVVGGVDSYHHPEVLRWLDSDGRLHALDVDGGFIPSEGAAFLWLGPAPVEHGGGARGPSRRVALAGVATAREGSVADESPNVAEAMTSIVHRLVDGAAQPVGWIVSDVNGERHRVREWALVQIRAAFAPEAVHTRGPDDLGDVGAASGALFAAIATASWRTGAAPAPSALVALHAEGTERGVLLLEERA